ncbi:hypothetical protein L0244_08760 [bacterium]|nr:hypothetical protein [bacterium]
MKKATVSKGIQFVTDTKGRKTAVQIDLKKHGELWEDFYDVLTAKQRKDEPRESFESVKKRLRAGAN